MVKLFSAMINEADARDRQQKYFNALRTCSKTQVILGVFQQREVTCRGDCGQKYIIQDEKKTDVNMAVEMLSDAFENQCDHMCIVTADSDVQPAVEWVAKNRPSIRLTVYVPALPSEQNARRTDYYVTKGLKVECSFLPLQGIKEHQLRNLVKLPDGKFAVRPHIWSSPVQSC